MPAPAPLAWIFPFIGLLLTIALAPLLAARFWHRHYGKIAAFWAVSLLIPWSLVKGMDATEELVAEALLHNYLPFVALLTALFTIAGGVRLSGTLHGTPAVNTALLLGGTLVASLAGTTGAAMLFIRPLIRANRRRRHNQHVFVFFIILVANIGGALTPLGDPPLFLGLLQGVPFLWPTRHLLGPTAFVAAILLAIFYALDRHYWRRAAGADAPVIAEIEKLGLRGRRNLPLLGMIPATLLLSGLTGPLPGLSIGTVVIEGQLLGSVAIFAAMTALSLRWTSPALRRANEFAWAPMREVAVIFAAIFITIAPVLAMLKAGEGAPDAFLHDLLNPAGLPRDRFYFWLTGLLSAFLDNAPTYLLFFNLAGGDAADLTGRLASTLLAISAGAVFFGALTYIGNAPNLMVKAIAEQSGIDMPGFLTYLLWSAGLLLPLFGLVTWVFL